MFFPQCPGLYPLELFPIDILVEPFKQIAEFTEFFQPAIFIKKSLLFLEIILSCFSLLGRVFRTSLKSEIQFARKNGRSATAPARRGSRFPTTILRPAHCLDRKRGTRRFPHIPIKNSHSRITQAATSGPYRFLYTRSSTFGG
jgi:hypothetical protein